MFRAVWRALGDGILTAVVGQSRMGSAAMIAWTAERSWASEITAGLRPGFSTPPASAEA